MLPVVKVNTQPSLCHHAVTLTCSRHQSCQLLKIKIPNDGFAGRKSNGFSVISVCIPSSLITYACYKAAMLPRRTS